MQACRAYYQNGRFVPLETLKIPEGSQAIVTVLDFPVEDFNKKSNSQLEAFDALIAEIHESGEEVPEFERVKLARNFDL
ncbi:MAG: DUF104 domain-containing protein [Sporomusaceae bacterium]|jgi:predicted DNA-binding antitoxin AbrB/MazE fold protein|nr:DUF104 domain-containing protein [Sporomusaceae bacterium]